MRSLVSLLATTLALWVLISRVSSEYFSLQLEISLLKVVAKCPGLPGGSSPGHTDYIDIAIDLGLGVVAAVFIALTIRDIRRRKNFSADDENQEGDDL
jgi:hypothetical protein